MSIEQENRYSLIVEYIQKHSSATQVDIVAYLKKKEAYTSQATVARALKDLGYSKINGKYTKNKESIISEQEVVLKNLIAYDEPRIFSSSQEMFQVILSTKKGMEQSIADLISKIYENKIIGTFVGNGCVMIITTSKKNSNSIKETLRSYKKTPKAHKKTT